MLRKLNPDKNEYGYNISKKGQDAVFGTIIIIIIIAISAVLILSVTKYGFDSIYKDAAFDNCRNSNLFRMASAQRFAGVDISFGPLKCETQDKVLSGSKEDVEKEFANLIGECWEEFLEGSRTPMFGDFDNARDKCFVCFTVNIDEIDEPIDTKEYWANLNDYTYVRKSAFSDKEKKVKLLDYIQKYGYIYFASSEVSNAAYESDSWVGLKLEPKKATYAIAFASEGWLTYANKDTTTISDIINYIKGYYSYTTELPRNSIIVDRLDRLSGYCSVSTGGD